MTGSVPRGQKGYMPSNRKRGGPLIEFEVPTRYRGRAVSYARIQACPMPKVTFGVFLVHVCIRFTFVSKCLYCFYFRRFVSYLQQALIALCGLRFGFRGVEGQV